jgi:D-alanine-D-alanine ligase
LPTWEIFLDHLPEDAARIATRKVKWDLEYQDKYKVRIGRAKDLPEELERRIARLSRRICRRLGTDGCVRIDFRLDEEGQLYFLEANPNPDIAEDEEFASAAEAAGIDYLQLLQKIVSLGIRRAVSG